MVGLMWAAIGRTKEKAGLFGANSSISSNELEGLRWEAFHEISLEKII
jgi:hypothetical protein